MSVYARLGYNFDSTLFNGADQLTTGVLNLLGNTSINLSTWQINDLSNASVGGYYQNPHNNNLGVISTFVTGIAAYANTQTYGYSDANTANLMSLAAVSAYSSLVNFTNHTNNISGVTRSSNTAVYPDLSSALAIGRQMLNITNKTDGVQNNTPILGSFTSLYIGNTLSSFATTLAQDYIILNNSFASGNANSNISSSTMNTIIYDIQSMQSVIDTRKNADISFYQNSYQVMQEYNYVLQFSNLGATQNNLFLLIGTNKLDADLA